MFTKLRIDLTKLGKIVRENPDLVKKGQFADGEHQLFDVIIQDKSPDQYGNNICAHCEPKTVADSRKGTDAKRENKWYIGDGKAWPEREQTAPNPATPNTTASPSPFVTPPSGDSGNTDLPF